MKFSAAIMLLLSLMGTGSATVQAETGSVRSLDYQACRTLVSAGEILSMNELMKLVRSLSDGKILDTRLLEKDNEYIYEMEIAGSDGMVSMLYIDARTGAIAEPVYNIK